MGYIVLYEWKIIKKDNNEETTLAVRNDEVTEFTFREGGAGISYLISLSITYRYRETGVEGSVEQDESDMLRFSLRSSSLTVYNAFSPNDDGVNDKLRVKTQSLLKFRMAIFNRWGQRMASGDHARKGVSGRLHLLRLLGWQGEWPSGRRRCLFHLH